MLCPRPDLKKIGAPEFEVNICRIEMVEEKWSDGDALRVAPRFWRGATTKCEWEYEDRNRVAIMGVNIVVLEEDVLNWVPIENMDGPPFCSFPLPAWGGRWFTASFCNLKTSTLYLLHHLQDSL